MFLKRISEGGKLRFSVCIDESKNALSRVVDDLDKIGETRALKKEEITARQEAVGRIWSFNCMEEISWR